MITCPHCHQEIPEWWTLTATLPEDTRRIVDEAITELAKEGINLSGGKRIAMGRVVEALAASYVAGQRISLRELRRQEDLAAMLELEREIQP